MSGIKYYLGYGEMDGDGIRENGVKVEVLVTCCHQFVPRPYAKESPKGLICRDGFGCKKKVR